MKQIETDICVIGGGSGGLSLAAGAVQMGANVVLFEGGKMGGDCLNSGCVPSKALLAAAKAAYQANGNAAMGIKNNPPQIDFAAVKAHVASVIATIEPHDSIARFEGLGVTVIPEMAYFTGPREVRSATASVRAKYIVIASGSRPMLPPIPGLDEVDYHTNETIFADREKPDHLLIIGGGPIGVEMAQAHARLGCNVTLIEAVEIMTRDDPELVAILRQELIKSGVKLIEGIGVTGLSQSTRKGRSVITASLANGKQVTGSHLLMAVGREPALDNLGLDAAKVRHNGKGIITDRRLRASNRHVYAIGDVAGRQQFTHIAGYHAGIVIRNILFKIPAKLNDDAVPWVTYCDPELAHVGLGYHDAKSRFGADKITSLRAPLSGNDRAIAEQRGEGMVKIITHKDGRILGASILAPAAGEIILAWSHAIASKAKIGSMANLIAPYPTYGDASKRAAGSFFTNKLFSPATRRLVRFLLKF